ncbi:unnamed protein product [Trichogramma brassicae]|uniref:Uncharacterized protein n=1 Tax=Trichogramma brassicae TaxID=86971 RepID=A0A6H5IUY3_9HYME|nr:unnamed protein product [Trichogramma brassicae]
MQERGPHSEVLRHLEKRKTKNVQEVTEKEPKEIASIPTTPAFLKSSTVQANTSTPVLDPQKRNSAAKSKSTLTNTFKRPASSPANPTNYLHGTISTPKMDLLSLDARPRAINERRDEILTPCSLRFKMLSNLTKKTSTKTTTAILYLLKNLQNFCRKRTASDIHSVSLQFTGDTDRLVDMLSDTRCEISCPNLKARLLRSIDKLSRTNVTKAFSDTCARGRAGTTQKEDPGYVISLRSGKKTPITVRAGSDRITMSRSPRRGLTRLAIDGAQHSHDEVRSENHTHERAPDAGAKAQLERMMAPDARTTLTR